MYNTIYRSQITDILGRVFLKFKPCVLKRIQTLIRTSPPTGIEPVTFRLTAECSNQLS